MTDIRHYLSSCAALTRLCTQNGWIDDATLQVKILERCERMIKAEVAFEEIVVEGSGCVADRKACFGLIALKLDARGDVTALEVL
jgi:hypothetical protein